MRFVAFYNIYRDALFYSKNVFNVLHPSILIHTGHQKTAPAKLANMFTASEPYVCIWMYIIQTVQSKNEYHFL